MDLLEYLREKNKMTREVWEDTFEKEEIEILVLRHEGGGASKRNGFWDAAEYFLAYMDTETGALYKDEGRIVYPVSDDENERRESMRRLEDETIYRLKVRRKKPETVPDGITASSQNRFLLVEILEKNASCPQLEEMLKEYRKPVVLQDDILGELILNKRFGCFEGRVSWQSKEIDISLDVNKDNKGSWTRAKKAMRAMLNEQKRWDSEMRDFAANKLTALACEWRESEDESAPEISERSFAKRIEITSISMTSGGIFSVYFNDDDMFLGHCVTVKGSLKKGVISADMEG